MGSIFISHAAKDEALVDDFVDLLRTGVNLPPESVFCSTIKGMGIPSDVYFLDYIKQKLRQSDAVILLVSQHFLLSRFCLDEASAAWALDIRTYPLLIPPVAPGDLKTIYKGRQVGRIDAKADLNELRDGLVRGLHLQPLPTVLWESRRDKFIERLNRLSSAASGNPSPEPKPDRVAFRVRATGDGKSVDWSKLRKGQIEEKNRISFSVTVVLTDVVNDLHAQCKSLDASGRIKVISPNQSVKISFDLELLGKGFRVTCGKRLARGDLNPFAAEFGENFDVLVSIEAENKNILSQFVGLLQSKYECLPL